MKRSHKLSLWQAILININIMFGAGIFINTVPLAQHAGALGFLSYIIIAIMIFPLLLAIAALINKYPSGGFYTYAARTISPLAGFISAWSYFIGKNASAALLVHVFSSLLQAIIPSLYIIPTLILDLAIIILFTWLNMHHMKTGTQIMYVFIFLKLFPIVFAIMISIYIWNQWYIPSETLLWHNIPSTLPIVQFAFVGFEACCSISKSIYNAKINGPKSIYYSFLFVIGITIIYQLLIFAACGPELMMSYHFLNAFPILLSNVFTNQFFAYHLANILHIAAASAALGGCYGILFSVHWNLYYLAQNGHTFFKEKLVQFNTHHIPTWCVLIQSILCYAYILLTNANIITLQQMSVLGITISYTFAVLSLLMLYLKKIPVTASLFTILSALGSCFFLIVMCIRNLSSMSIMSFILLPSLLILGILMYYATKQPHSHIF